MGPKGLQDETPTCCCPKGYILEMVFSPLQHCRWSEVPGDSGIAHPGQGNSSADLKPSPIPTNRPCLIGWQCPLALALVLLTSNAWCSRQQWLGESRHAVRFPFSFHPPLRTVHPDPPTFLGTSSESLQKRFHSIKPQMVTRQGLQPLESI